MLAQYFRSQADCFIRIQSSLCINIQCQFIVVSDLTDTSVLNCQVYTLYRL